MPLGAAVLALVQLEAERQREGVLIGEEEQRAEKVVPREHELEKRHDGERRCRERQVDAPEDLELGRAVEASSLRADSSGCCMKNCRKRKMLKALPKKARHPERLQGADPAERLGTRRRAAPSAPGTAPSSCQRQREDSVSARPFESREDCRRRARSRAWCRARPGRRAMSVFIVYVKNGMYAIVSP